MTPGSPLRSLLIAKELFLFKDSTICLLDDYLNPISFFITVFFTINTKSTR